MRVKVSVKGAAPPHFNHKWRWVCHQTFSYLCSSTIGLHWAPTPVICYYRSLSMIFHFRDGLSSLSQAPACAHTTNPWFHNYTLSFTHISTQIQLATYQNINSSYSLTEPCSPRPFCNNKSPPWIYFPASEGSSRLDSLRPSCMAALTAIYEKISRRTKVRLSFWKSLSKCKTDWIGVK